jgi:hypothetical protein
MAAWSQPVAEVVVLSNDVASRRLDRSVTP